MQIVRNARTHPLGDYEVDRPRALTATIHQEHARPFPVEAPLGPRRPAVWARMEGRLDRRTRVDELRRIPAQHSRRLRKSEVRLAGPSSERAGGESRVAVSRLLHDRDAVRHGVGERDAGRVPARADDETRALAPIEGSDSAPGAHSTADGLPVLPRPRAVERM